MCTTTRRSHPPRRLHDGFSLVEVLVAIGIFMTTAASIPQLFTAATRANTDAGAVTWATRLAAQKIEELTAQPTLDAVEESIDYLDRGGQLAPLESSTPAYERRWSVEPVPSAVAGTLVVNVVVSRYRAGGTAADPRDTVRLATVYTRTVP